jgi:glycosyltransferase involved in cell wall biosynthesis
MNEVMRATLGSAAHDGGTEGPIHRWLQRCTKQAFSKADGVVTVSEFDRQYVVREGMQPANRVTCIENSLPEEFLGLQSPVDRRPVIGFCGSWIPRKGAGVLQDALSRLLAAEPTLTAKLIGVGPDLRPENVVGPPLSSRVEIIPFVANKREMRRHYESISVLVVPSIYESFGLVTAEAMACGCAVVATRTGFAAGLQDGVEARLLNDVRPETLFHAIGELLSHEPLRRRIATQGQQRVQRLDWSSAVAELERTYIRWMGAGGTKKSSGRI